MNLLHEWVDRKDGETEAPADDVLIESELGCSGDLWTKAVRVFTEPKNEELERKFSEVNDPEDGIIE